MKTNFIIAMDSEKSLTDNSYFVYESIYFVLFIECHLSLFGVAVTISQTGQLIKKISFMAHSSRDWKSKSMVRHLHSI